MNSITYPNLKSGGFTKPSFIGTLIMLRKPTWSETKLRRTKEFYNANKGGLTGFRGIQLEVRRREKCLIFKWGNSKKKFFVDVYLTWARSKNLFPKFAIKFHKDFKSNFCDKISFTNCCSSTTSFLCFWGQP